MSPSAAEPKMEAPVEETTVDEILHLEGRGLADEYTETLSARSSEKARRSPNILERLLRLF